MPPRNRNRNRGGGGGDQNKITLQVGASGKRNDCKIGVVLRKGRFGLPNEQVMFRFGTPDRPQGPWLMDPANPQNRYTLITDTEGEKESGAFDFSAEWLKNYNQLLVVYRRAIDPGQGIYEQAIQLPVLDATEGPKAQEKGKPKFVVDVEGDVVIAKKFYAVIPLETSDDKGKPDSRKVEATLVVGQPVTFKDARANVVLAKNSRFYEPLTSDGSLHLGVEFLGQFEVSVELRDPASKQKRTFRLVYKQ